MHHNTRIMVISDCRTKKFWEQLNECPSIECRWHETFTIQKSFMERPHVVLVETAGNDAVLRALCGNARALFMVAVCSHARPQQVAALIRHGFVDAVEQCDNPFAFMLHIRRLVALSRLLDGMAGKYFRFFLPFLSSEPSSVAEWAQAACVSRRYMEKICMISSCRSPVETIDTFQNELRNITGQLEACCARHAASFSANTAVEQETDAIAAHTLFKGKFSVSAGVSQVWSGTGGA